MVSKHPDIQKIVVSLSTTDISLEPGQVAQLVVTMSNLQDGPDRLAIEVEGVDVEWYMIPVPAVNVAAGASVSERVLFKVARNSANLAGAYPFLLRVQAMETGEIGVAQATLTVKPFGSLQVEINPKRALATFVHPLNDFDVTVANMGNEDVNLQLFATDPDDGCAYEFDFDHLTLRPGQTEMVPLAVRPKVSAVLGGSQLYQFSATARSVDDSYLAGNVHGQIEKRALISPLVGIFGLLILLGAGLWMHFRPPAIRPIHINSFTSNLNRVVYGSSVLLSWDVSGTNPQIILQRRVGEDGQDVNDPGEQAKPVGVVAVKPDSPKTYFTLIVRGPNGQPEQKKDLAVAVDPPPTPPLPRISRFEADYQRIHPGDFVNLSFVAENCKDLILDPDAVHLNPNDMNHKVQPVETTVYALRGIPDSGQQKQVSKTITITVIPRDQCLADITSFAVKEKVIYVGSVVHLLYNVKNAHGLHISTDNNSLDRELDPRAKGVIDVQVDATTTFILKATDSAGLVSTRQVTVVPTPKPVADPAPGTGSPPAGQAPPPVTSGQ